VQPLTVGLIGRLSPWKGQHVFLAAAAEVLKEFPNSRYRLIGAALFGEEAYGQTLVAQAAKLGIAQSVDFCGFRADIPEQLAALDLLVHASVTGEPFGQVVIEGMAAGKPVVATNGGGIPEIVVDGETGILVPMGDSAALALAIRLLLADEPLRLEMGRRGRERVMRHFTIEQTARGVQDVYDQMLGRLRVSKATYAAPVGSFRGS